MTDVTIYSIVAVTAAVLAMIAGRVFAMEGGKHIFSVLAAGYVGAGVGLMSSVLIGPLLALIAQYLNTSTTWFDALDVAGTTLFWGTLAGAAGGLAIGMVVMALPSTWFR
jgi:hypothetical protein